MLSREKSGCISAVLAKQLSSDDYVTLATEHLISHTTATLVDTIASLQDSDGGVMPVSEVYKLLTKIHDIQNNAVSKYYGNSAHI